MGLKHGLYSRQAVIPGESREAFRDYRADTILDQQPIVQEEADLVEQMVLAQWQLKRVWATQTGVYERFEQAFPAEGGASHPERLAQCFLDDCAHGQALDRLSRHVTRLVNVYHKASRKLELLRDQRRKLLSRPKGVPYAGEPVVYAPPEPVAPVWGGVRSGTTVRSDEQARSCAITWVMWLRWLPARLALNAAGIAVRGLLRAQNGTTLVGHDWLAGMCDQRVVRYPPVGRVQVQRRNLDLTSHLASKFASP
jgi:hypothetical protein